MRRVKLSKFKSVFKGHLFEIKQAKAVFPSGRKKIFERCFRLPTVIVIAIDAKERILLIREYRLRHKRYVWNLPAGRFESIKESPKKAALRELREEAGYTAKNLKLLRIIDQGSTLVWRTFVFVAKGLVKAPLKGDEDEDISVVPTSLTKAYKMALKGAFHFDSMAYQIIRYYQDAK